MIVKYTETLNYYNSLSFNQQNDEYVTISTEIEHYRSLLEYALEGDDINFYNTEKVKFNKFVKMYERFGRDLLE